MKKQTNDCHPAKYSFCSQPTTHPSKNTISTVQFGYKGVFYSTDCEGWPTRKFQGPTVYLTLHVWAVMKVLYTMCQLLPQTDVRVGVGPILCTSRYIACDHSPSLSTLPRLSYRLGTQCQMEGAIISAPWAPPPRKGAVIQLSTSHCRLAAIVPLFLSTKPINIGGSEHM